jgi:VanZ family protein
MTRQAGGYSDAPRVSARHRAARLLWLWGPAAAMMVLIFFASAIPNVGPLPGQVSDKTAHFAAYALLAAFVLRALASARLDAVSARGAVWAWLVAAAYGASDEWHQRLVPGRTPSAADWLADAAGAAFAVALILGAAAWTGRLHGRDI